MKKIKILIASFLVFGITLLMSSCSPENHTLGKTLNKSDIDFEIVQDFTADPGGNTVIMTNKTDNVVLTWNYVLGRSNKKIDTVKYAFKGDYTIKITAITEGGHVELDPITITVTDDNLNHVKDPLWTALSGGVGESKTWVVDNGQYGLAPGAMAFADPSETQEFQNFTPNWEPEGNAYDSTDEQMGWGSTMTFSLINGPFMTTNKLNEGGIDESGTYFLDVNSYTLTTTDATILRSDLFIENANNWNNDLKILELTEDQLRIAILRTNDEAPWYYIWNYVSKDYADSYVPEDLPDPNPDIHLNGGTVDDLLSVTTSTSKTWYLSPDSPFNWTKLDGTFLNEFNAVEDYEAVGWTGYVSGDQATVINNKITFSDDGTISTIDSNGIASTGTYTTSTDGTNIISFSDITPSFPIGSSWATATTTSENQWKIVKTAKATGAAVTDIWFGKRDESGKNEYMVFHFVLDDANGGNTDIQGTEITFDNSKLSFGDLEANGNLRLELYNDFGATKDNPPLDISQLVFSNKIEITFTLGGITLNPGAVGSYITDISYADGDWDPGYWGDNTNGGHTTVTGNGTYTVSYTASTDVDGAVVFVIDAVGLATDITDISAVTATIDSVIIY